MSKLGISTIVVLAAGAWFMSLTAAAQEGGSGAAAAGTQLRALHAWCARDLRAHGDLEQAEWHEHLATRPPRRWELGQG